MSDYEKEYKALLKRVDDLEDTIIKLKRNLKDDLENLDIDNFSESFKVKQDKASLEIERTAKELSVKMEDYDTSMIKMQSKIRQTARNISLRVTKSDVEKMISSAEFAVDVDGIKSEVKKYADEQISTAAETITAESITQTVSRAFFEVVKINDSFSSEGKDTEKIYFSKEDNASYYYNSISKEWKETSGKSIYSAFIQTDDGFEFDGDVVKMSGDLITGGSITGSRLYSARKSEFIKIGESGFGDLTLYSSSKDSETGKEIVSEKFSVLSDAESIDLKAIGTSFLRSSGSTTYCCGAWDFSDATVFFEDDGVNAIAVFG